MKNTLDNTLLLVTVFPECISVHMDMQTAGVGHVRPIAEPHCFMKYIFPIHIVYVVSKRHRMGHDLEAVIEAAVRLDVNVLTAGICLRFDTAGIFLIFAAEIDFEFNTEKSRTLAIKHRLRLIAVLLDFGVQTVITVCAVRQIVVPKHVAVVQNAPAPFAATIVVIEAAGAKCGAVIAD